ncbi:TPA: AAA family ATPase [Acinetobacter baumannii]|uniref:AAA family ATPase n=1 Tax=Acinetobacter baumannii TaxID=470 RepID=UPI001128BEFD|nr:AAA family ATPase [Acinetobacter baumannii]TPT30754.1 ATP-binding protein [Acinetobacter baumannii]HAV3471737.1 ATP-binding protein [Acinetobacter baumannii]HCW4111220.1 AAA family ATPase [Acinetobacter baumannii]
MSRHITLVKSLNVIKFRALNDLKINFGERVTVICGKNGTAKSTILGLLAQIFSFEKDYTTDTELPFTPLHSPVFKSKFSEHFRLSEKFDLPGGLEASYELYDAYFRSDITPILKLYNYKDRKLPRAVVRNNITNSTVTNDSRNVTHPVIYLSLNRLIPIVNRHKYETKDLEFLNNHKDEFIRINNQLLCKTSGSLFTPTTGSIESVAVHSTTYDHESVSAGEDNAGQIIQAIFSFKKLKEEYGNYHGGLLLIDEADAGLFPGAQYQLKEILNRYAKELNIQVVFTTHSPILIEEYYKLSQRDHKNFKTIYLSNKLGKIQIFENYSWTDIYADISVKMKEVSPELSFPETNVYFEDDEARAFFNALVTQRKVKKPLKLMKDISMGCGNYLELIRQKVPEFDKLSLLILDGDVPDSKIKAHRNVVKLPGDIPPDQLLFEFLYKLPEDDLYWDNKLGFTKLVFNTMSSVTSIYNALSLPHQPSESFSLKAFIDNYRYPENEMERLRALFKNFFKSVEIQALIKNANSLNPYRYLVSKNPSLKENFTKDLIFATKHVLTKSKGISSHLVETWYENV